ncbi:MAG TPA: sialidase [Gammaproteobacteria bacterium]|nr:sialidase [Gammaproteobacteria bacterium]
MKKGILCLAITLFLATESPLLCVAAEVTLLESPAVPPASLSRVVANNKGSLILSWVESDDETNALYYSSLVNEEFSKPEKISSGKDWFVNWADFPFVIATDRSMTAHWLKKRDAGTYNYDVVAVFRNPITNLWSEPRIIHTDGVSAEHGFVSMLPLSDNKTLISWLDGRNTTDHKPDVAAKHLSGGMTLRAGIFDADGNTITEWQLDDLVCDCCQTSVAMSSRGPVIVYRDRSETELRDIYITRFDEQSWTTPIPVYKDNWEISGCPVNGPSVTALNRQIAVGWFSAKNDQPSVNLSLSSDNGKSFANTVTVAQGNTNGRVSVAMLRSGKVAISWLETAGKLALLKVASYDFDGNLQDTAIVAETVSSRQSGFPVITSRNDDIFVTWTDVLEKKHVRVAIIRF